MGPVMTKRTEKPDTAGRPAGKAKRPAAELEVEVEIPASPKRVWEVLTDFEAYAQWHPYETISGPATKFGRIRVESRKLKSEVVHHRSGRVIMRFEEEVALETAEGSPFFWGTSRWYHLQATAKGTLLRHGIRFFGFVARRAFRTTHRISGLQPYLDAVSAATSRRAMSRNWRRPTGGNRHSRRASRAKGRHHG